MEVRYGFGTQPYASRPAGWCMANDTTQSITHAGTFPDTTPLGTGKEDRKDHLLGESTFQQNQQGDYERQNQAYAPQRDNSYVTF